jgi:manganese/iron transport system permease protein
VSLSPTSVNIQTIVLGNILAITPEDTLQLVIISGVSLVVLLAKWKDLMVVFFDETHARSIGLNPFVLKAVFFTLLSACTVAALQTVGAFLVIAVSVAVGSLSSFAGAYLSYFLDGATGGIIVVLQTLVFLAAFVFAPKHGMLAARRKARATLAEGT